MGQKAESVWVLWIVKGTLGDNVSIGFCGEFDLSTAQGPIKTIRFTIDEVYPEQI